MFSHTSKNAGNSQMTQPDVSMITPEEAASPSSSPIYSAHPFLEKCPPRSPTAKPKRAFISISRGQYDQNNLNSPMYLSEPSRRSSESFDPSHQKAVAVDGFSVEQFARYKSQDSDHDDEVDGPLTWADGDGSTDYHSPQTAQPEILARNAEQGFFEMQNLAPSSTSPMTPHSSERCDLPAFDFLYAHAIIPAIYRERKGSDFGPAVWRLIWFQLYICNSLS